MKKATLLLIICALCLLLASCSTEETPPTTEPAAFDISELSFSKATVALKEAEDVVGSAYSLKKDMEITEYNGITYAFEPKIPLEDRGECIRSTEAILSRIGADRAIQINIYTVGTYDSTFINEGVVYTCLQDWETPEYISALLYGLFGAYCNYGTVYGYANYLAMELYGTPVELCGGDWAYDGDPGALDLNLLCFRPEFTEEEDIRNVKKLANSFAAEYIAEYGETELHTLLESSGNVEKVSQFADILANFYASRSIDYMPSDILYRLGGKSYDYIAKCQYAVMYVEEDWYDANKDLCPYTYDGFLHQNYGDTRQFFTVNAEQMGKYQDLFSLDGYNNDLDIYFSNTAAKTSAYMQQIHAICVRNTGSFMHEYIHALTIGSSLQEAWATEGFARYYSYRFDYYGNAMSNVDYNTVPDTSQFRYIHEYKNEIGRDIDVSRDMEELWHIATYAYSFDDPNDRDGYTAGASFIAYLISRFGEEKVIEIICVTHDFGEYAYSDLVADWQSFILENYASYSKYK